MYKAPGVSFKYINSNIKPNLLTNYYIIIDSPSQKTTYLNVDTISISGRTNAPEGLVVNATFNSVTKSTIISSEGTWMISDIDLSAIDDGEYPLTISLVDEYFFTTNTTIFVVIDSKEPVIVVDLEDGVNYTNNNIITVIGTLIEENLQSLKIEIINSLNDIVYQDEKTTIISNNWSFTTDFELEDDQYIVKITAIDKSNNENHVEKILILDTISPTNPTEIVASTTESTTDIYWSPSYDEGSGVSHYEIYLDGELFAVTTDANYTLFLTEGNITIKAVDFAGNISNESSETALGGA